MSSSGVDHDALIEGHREKMREVSEARNILVRELFMMLRRRGDMGAFIHNAKDSDGDLDLLVDTYDLVKHPDTGYLGHLSEAEIAALVDQHAGSSSPKSQSRSTPVRGDRKPQLKRPTLHDPIDDDEPDELDLLSPKKRPRTKSPASTTRRGSSMPSIPTPSTPQDGEPTSSPPEPTNYPAERVVEREQSPSPPRTKENSPPPLQSAQVAETAKASTVTRPEPISRPDQAGSVPQPVPSEPPRTILEAGIQPPPSLSKDLAAPSSVQLSAEGTPLAIGIASVSHTVRSPGPLAPSLPTTPSKSENGAPYSPLSIIQVPSISQVASSMASTPPPAPLQSPQEGPISGTTPNSQKWTVNPVPLSINIEADIRSITTTEPEFTFDGVAAPSFTAALPTSIPKISPARKALFDAEYTLPPLRSLPLEFKPKKNSSKRKKKDKEKERNPLDGILSSTKKGSDDWSPTSFVEWNALIRANPVWKRTSKATKCLLTSDWSLALTEMKLWRAFDRIEALKDFAKWSGRQPKKHRQVLNKTHWDHLLDEMKWMRIDFREERKWKLALAYTLSTAVLEWHAAGSNSVRLDMGIIGQWRRPPPPSENPTPNDKSPDPNGMEIDPPESQQPAVQSDAAPNALGIDYGSDDEDEEEEKQSAVDASEIAALMSEQLEPPVETVDASLIKEFDLKTEPNEEDASLLATMDVDEKPDLSPQSSSSQTDGLKPSSTNPIISSAGGDGTADHYLNPSDSSLYTKQAGHITSGAATKPNPYTRLRDAILFEIDEQSMFISLDKFKDLTLSSNDPPPSYPPDFSAIFPELHTYSLLDPVSLSLEGGKRNKGEKKIHSDDPRRRTDDIGYPKMYPASPFMYSKPTLLGPLQPSKRWTNGEWLNWDINVPVLPFENPPIPPETSSDMFDPKVSHQLHVCGTIHNMDKIPVKESSSFWTESDDAILKSIVDRFPGTNNWPLMAELFNAARKSTSSDKKYPRDLFERFREKWQSDLKAKYGMPTGAPPQLADIQGSGALSAAAGQVMTRKRTTSTNASSALESGGENRKRRRHVQIEVSMRKAGKKRQEYTQKQAASQRKAGNIHETHNQFARMKQYGPIELSRLKSDRERENAENAARKRQEAAATAAAVRISQGQVPGQPVQGQQSQPGATQQPQQPQQSPQQQQPQPQQQSPPPPPPPPQQQQPSQVAATTSQGSPPLQQAVTQTTAIQTGQVAQAGRQLGGQASQVNISHQQRGSSPANIGGVINVGTPASRTPSRNSNSRQTPAPNGMQSSPPHQFAMPTSSSTSPPQTHLLSGSPRSSAATPNPMSLNGHLSVTQQQARPPSAQGQPANTTANVGARALYNVNVNAGAMAHHLNLNGQNPTPAVHQVMNANMAALLAQGHTVQHLQANQAQAYANYQWTPEQMQALRHYQQAHMQAQLHQQQQQQQAAQQQSSLAHQSPPHPPSQ